jgi:hypothetical protein
VTVDAVWNVAQHDSGANISTSLNGVDVNGVLFVARRATVSIAVTRRKHEIMIVDARWTIELSMITWGRTIMSDHGTTSDTWAKAGVITLIAGATVEAMSRGS